MVFSSKSERNNGSPNPLINNHLPLFRDYDWDPDIKALKRRGFVNHGSTVVPISPKQHPMSLTPVGFLVLEGVLTKRHLSILVCVVTPDLCLVRFFCACTQCSIEAVKGLLQVSV